MTQLILIKDQAKALYAAMCALNYFSGHLRATLLDDEGDYSIVVEHHITSEKVSIIQYGKPSRWESYDNPDAFAAAYGIT